MKTIACILNLAALLARGAPSSCWAMLAPSRPAGTADLITAQRALESKMLRRRFKDLGLNDREIQARLEELSPREVHRLASNIHGIRPAGDAGELIGVLAAALGLLIVLLVRSL